MSYTVQDEEWRDYNLTCKGKLFFKKNKKKNEEKITWKGKKKKDIVVRVLCLWVGFALFDVECVKCIV